MSRGRFCWQPNLPWHPLGSCGASHRTLFFVVTHGESARGCGVLAITIEQHSTFTDGAKVLTRFHGRTALVTGASRGIGAAVAVLLAKQGADVAINFRSKGSRAEQIAAEVQALGRRSMLAQADLTDESGVNAMADAIRKTFGQLHVLVLNASGGLEKD